MPYSVLQASSSSPSPGTTSFSVKLDSHLKAVNSNSSSNSTAIYAIVIVIVILAIAGTILVLSKRKPHETVKAAKKARKKSMVEILPLHFLVNKGTSACGICHCLNISCAHWLFMSFRPQTGSRRSAARQYSKSAHEKKAKEKKQRLGGNYHQEETEISAKEVVEKNLGILSKLGNQIFALSPFSQYFDDWLVNLRQIISEFESNPSIKVDEQFVKERSQIFLDVEGALAEKRLQETNLTGEAKELADNNHLLVETDKEYAEKARELSFKRNADVQRLSTEIRELEDDVAGQEEIKIRFYKVMARRKAAEKLAQTRQALKSAKNELEVALQSFTAEQEKLHDNYEKKKQEITERVDALHKELEKLETDTSIDARQAACNALANAINALLQRTPLSPESQ